MAANFWRSTHRRRWLFTAENLSKWHNECRGPFDLRESHEISEYCIDIVQSIGKSLNWRQPVVATAILLFKRFFVRASLKDFDPRLVVPTCLYIAGKVEEMGQIKVEIVINELNRVVKSKDFGANFPAFTSAQVHECEFYLLEKLGCDLVIFHPYCSLETYVRDSKLDEQIFQASWSVLNDSYRTDVSLLYPPHLIALAAIYVGSVYHKHEVDVRNWLDKLNVNLDEVRDIVKLLMKLYEYYAEDDRTVRQQRLKILERKLDETYGHRYSSSVN